MKSILYIISVIIMFFAFGGTLCAQNKEGYNWYFGNYVGMTWNTTQTIVQDGKTLSGLPTPLPPSAMTNQAEGVFCMSDASGNLLFYSDGMTIWNKKHEVLTNGNGLTGHNSSAQSGIVIPYPGQPHLYIAISMSLNVSYSPHVGNTLAYSIIDMTKQGGLGEVTTKNIILTGAMGILGESVAAVRHTNGIDYWIIAVGKGNDTNSALNVWRVTTSGVQTACMGSYSLPQNTRATADSNGYLRFSSDGKKFAWAEYGSSKNLFFGTFDPSDGSFPIRKVMDAGYIGYGAEFSPSCEILYVSSQTPEGRIHTYKFAELLVSATSDNITPRILTTGIKQAFALQIAPDERIYSPKNSSTSMVVIDNVNDYDSSTVHIVAGLLPTGSGYQPRAGLPNYMPHFFTPVATINDTICQGENYNNNNFNLTNPATGYYRDTIPTISGDSIVTLNLTVNPVYNDTIYAYIPANDSILFGGNYYSTSGIYTDSLKTVYGCDSVVFLNLGISSTNCLGGTVIFRENFDKYGNGLNSTSSNLSTEFLPAGRTTYKFTSANRPVDGEYALAKHWNDGDWRINDDNTSPNDNSIGRFMLVNADYTPKVFYSHRIEDLCSGSQLYFSAMVANCHVVPSSYIRPDLTFSLLNATTNSVIASYNTGAIPYGTKPSDWQQWGFNFTVPMAVSAVILEIKNNAPGGGGNDLGLDDIEIRLCAPPVNVTVANNNVCEGDSIQLVGTFTNGGAFVTPLEYRWLKSPTGDLTSQASWTTVGSSSTLNIPSATLSDIGYYRLAVAGAGNINLENCRAMSDPIYLSVNPKYFAYSDTICSNETYNFNGKLLNVTGIYKDTIPSSAGCDSIITLDLTVNPAKTTILHDTICQIKDYSNYNFNLTNPITGSYHDTLSTIYGCDSIITLNLTVHPTFNDTIYTQICDNDSVFFGGKYYFIQNIYTDSLKTVFGCDSLSTLNLTVHPTFNDTIYTQICDADSTFFDGQYYSFGGFYTNAYTTINGCDSILNLQLTVYPTFNDTIYTQICDNDSVLFGGKYYFTQNIYTDSLKTAFGCDSLSTLNLTVHRTFNDTIYTQICDVDSTFFDGQYYSSSGFYTNTYTTINGCDSILNLQLTVHSTFNDTIYTEICDNDSVLFGGKYYFTQNIYTDSLKTVFGCDSLSTLNLTVHPTFSDTVYTEICDNDSILFNGKYYSIQGIYTDSLKTILGCDSLLLLNLTVHRTFNDTIYTQICDVDSTFFDGQYYSSGGFYTNAYTTINGCDSILNLQLTVCPTFNDTIYTRIYDNESVLFGGKYYSTQGIYTDSLRSVFGCDSVSTLNLSVYLSFDAELLELSTICRGVSDFSIEFDESRGIVDYYSLAFDAKARAVGFSDVTMAPFANTIIINLPPNIRPNNYKVNITLENTAGYVQEYPLDFMIRYPSSVMAQKWNDVIALYNSDYNGGYEYSAIQWYKNGNMLYGETHSYIYLENSIFTAGDEYSALLTRTDDGESVFTCPLIVVVRALSTQVYPTILSAGETINIISPKTAKASIYNTLGILSTEQSIGEGSNTITNLNRPGFYFIIVSDEEGVFHRQTIIVK